MELCNVILPVRTLLLLLLLLWCIYTIWLCCNMPQVCICVIWGKIKSHYELRRLYNTFRAGTADK